MKGTKSRVDGASRVERASDTVLVRESEETFEVTPEEEAALLRAVAEADRGDFVSAEQVLEDLRKPPLRT